MLVEDFVQLLLVCDIALYVVRLLAADELDSIDDFWRRVVEVVDYHDLVVGFEECEGGEGADVARAAMVNVSLAYRLDGAIPRTRSQAQIPQPS